MKVIIPKSSGFCPGVIRAESGVMDLHKEQGHVHIYGPLIHNEDYVSMLRDRNISSVDPDTLSANDTLVIRTHGIPRDQETILSKKFILRDLTCPIVKRVQKKVEAASQAGCFILISGKHNHAEVLGLLSYAKHSFVLETDKDLDSFLKNYRTIIPGYIRKICLISQTTYSRSFFQKISHCLESLQQYECIMHDTICSITENKERESIELQKKVDFTVVIGDTTSSNSKKLYQVLYRANRNTIFIRNVHDLRNQNISWDGKSSVLVVSSTSTPKFIEDKVVQFFETC